MTSGLQHGSASAGNRPTVGSAERLASIGVGVGLAACGAWCMLRGRPLSGAGMTLLGAVLAERGTSGRCWIYKALGVDSADAYGHSTPLSREVHTAQSITIAAPADELYGRWRDLPRIAEIMPHIRSIEPIDERRSLWRAAGPLNKELTWESEITEDQPGGLIAWRSLPGSIVETRGRVEFFPAAGGRGTVVRIELFYRPIGGAIGAGVGMLFGIDARHEVAEDLRRFKQRVETGEIATNQGPSARAPMPEPPDEPADEKPDPVQEASEESFPASDPPGWKGDHA